MFKFSFSALMLFIGLASYSSLNAQSRRDIPLDKNWQIRKLGEEQWSDVKVPGSFEEQLDVGFDGVAEYRIKLPNLELEENQRLVVHFDAAATETFVFLQGKKLGSHLGGWTPFRVDITDAYKTIDLENDYMVIRVDEKVGHNTQGFLPIVAPHFGGIWQPVKLIVMPSISIDDLTMKSIGIPGTNEIDLEFSLVQNQELHAGVYYLSTRLFGTDEWSAKIIEVAPDKQVKEGTIKTRVPILDAAGHDEKPLIWHIGDPNLYEIKILFVGRNAKGDSISDTYITRSAFRKIETEGKQLLLNGKPVAIRGVLNWGYTGRTTQPSIDESFMRKEIEFARDSGFNLMKFCLWVPPQRYLELCDEKGLLAWVEYPTWHPTFTPEFLDELRREYEEFFYFDRNHPSVVLRSLTCETGHGADLKVIQSLYDLCKQRIPDAIVEDDSSWISWQRVFDFYDDHPYGNNHTWPAKLKELEEYRQQHGDKPMVLGEAIAADTWVDSESLVAKPGDPRPFWAPWALDANDQWLKKYGHLLRADALKHLVADSKHYAMLMRKYQVERFRSDLPNAGYVVSVIRDFPKASMGLFDFDGNPKWKNNDWNWHRSAMLVLDVPGDRRSYFGGASASFQLKMVNSLAEGAIEQCEISAQLVDDGNVEFPIQKAELTSEHLVFDSMALFEAELPDVSMPTRATLKVRATYFDGQGKRTAVNSWPIWILPKVKNGELQNTWVSKSIASQTEYSNLLNKAKNQSEQPELDQVVVTSQLSTDLIVHIENGGKVLLLPDNKPGSFPLRSHWFLRGGVMIGGNSVIEDLRRPFFVELQHFDLARDVIPEINYLDQIDPILLLWDNHDMREIKTHALAFETQIGKGRLLVSTLKHTGETNAAGKWLLAHFINHLNKESKPRFALQPETIAAMKNRLTDQSIALWNRDWKFKPDPTNDGLERKLHQANFDDADWRSIRTDQHWEGQGFDNLDGWAWYRIEVEIPGKWDNKTYLNFTGVDDYYEVFINGKKAGSGGNIEQKQTAFDDRTSHDISEHVVPGRSNSISIRVYDWYGAGGIFRPVTLSTSPLNTGPRLLK